MQLLPHVFPTVIFDIVVIVIKTVESFSRRRNHIFVAFCFISANADGCSWYKLKG